MIELQEMLQAYGTDSEALSAREGEIPGRNVSDYTIGWRHFIRELGCG